jgi:hypothetical protein
MHLLNFGIKFSSTICLLGHLDFYRTRKSSDPTKAIGVGVSRDSARNSIFRFGSNNFGVSSPFYLKDEVVAHLDAQNTERLSKVMVERSNGSQILMVTLKESTVAKASQIF